MQNINTILIEFVINKYLRENKKKIKRFWLTELAELIKNEW